MLKRTLSITMVFVLICVSLFSINVSAADYTNGVAVSGSTATIWFKSNVSTTWVDVHYKVNSGVQQNVRMTYNSGSARYEQRVTVSTGNVISYSFTYNNGTPAYDTGWFSYTVGSTSGGGTTPTNGATFYADINYGGTAKTLGVGNYTLSQLNAEGIPNDWMSSLKVPSGWTVEVYQNDNFGGTKWTYTSSSSWVGTAVNDQMSSVKIFNTAGSGDLVWSDEFNGSSLDGSNWVYDIGTGGSGWGNNELQYYTNRSQNVQVTGGNLVITAQKESYGGKNYTSARIKTKGLRQFTYGKIEARIKLPSGETQGIWPAFWMLGSNMDSVGWPKCGEIDIMERVNKNAVVNGTVHWDNNGQYASFGRTSGNIDFSQYHVYRIEWDSKYIRWFVDGAQYNEILIENGTGNTEEFQKPFFLLFNLAVGGNWPGSPNGATTFPAKMYVDYVRVYR